MCAQYTQERTTTKNITPLNVYLYSSNDSETKKGRKNYKRESTVSKYLQSIFASGIHTNTWRVAQVAFIPIPWCRKRDLRVNPSETEIIPLTFYGRQSVLTKQVKYLGVILHSKLNWKEHVDAKCKKALAAF